LVSFFIVLTVLSVLLVTTVLSQWFDPRYSQMEARRQLIELYNKVDSLEHSVMQKDIFIRRVQFILNGDTTQTFEEMESALTINDTSAGTQITPDQIAPLDSQFRMEFENMELATVSHNISEELPFLFPPINGYPSQSYDLEGDHIGIDIVAKANEPVKSVADGTVVFADWTREFGYVMAIQHRSNLISVYKHNAQLLKKVGNFVNEGEIVSIIGNSGELTDGPHLHFELWYMGTPLNPEEFVLF